MAPVSNELLRRDVRMLGDMLGEVMTEAAGPEALALVEEIRQLARRRRSGDHTAEPELAEKIASLSMSDARIVARAFSIFFDLANLAEDRHRIRVLRSREQELHPVSLSESIGAAIGRLKESGFSAAETQRAIDKMLIELVFTAHPSEAKRRSIRAKLRRMRHALQELDRTDLLPRERARLESRIRTELTVLWQTDFLRPSRPTVLEEVERGLSITPRLWEVVPQVYASMRLALDTHYPGEGIRPGLFLRFGSWMGGDRDGNPNVTAPITKQTLVWLRERAISQHLALTKTMYDFLSISVREIDADSTLNKGLEEASQKWPGLAEALSELAPLEVYRRWVTMIRWRLSQSSATTSCTSIPEGGYRDGEELFADLKAMQDSLRSHHSRLLADSELQRWLDLTTVFGLHLTRLDVRQDARRYREVMTEILSVAGIVENYADLPEAERCAALSRSIPWDHDLDREKLSPLALETLDLFLVLRDAIAVFGPSCIGGHVISLTQCPSDVLNVLWLWRWAQSKAVRDSSVPTTDELRIIPLFEKIDDLRNAPETMTSILEHPLYREHVTRVGDRQIIMVGYSDSTKDGGYLAACWGLYQAQSGLQQVAHDHGVQVTFFHGRGGSLGRGGGPAARGILSLPPEALDGTLRLTEQGEVLAERYDDTQVAFRHLEQVTWATLVASALPGVQVKPSWLSMMETLSVQSFKAYRELVDQPGFIAFFAAATPIDEIENLPIGSRPSRRRGERTLGDLRAIPWVFSWTQNRCMIPAWYGLGTALSEVKYKDRTAWQTICEMYRLWPFMQATIDNAMLALAKADMYIAQHYSELAEDPAQRQVCWELIARERDRTRQALLDLVGGSELLSKNPWFQGSIEVRNPYIDPLNLIQIELLRRRRSLTPEAPANEAEQLRDMLRLTVQGIAAGMRTTG
nr:phosphoenolpyruvate carboxylase [Pirellula staleyi]